MAIQNVPLWTVANVPLSELLRATSLAGMTSAALAPAQIPCDGWTTPEFWRAVDPPTVRACLSRGYRVDDRSPFRRGDPAALGGGGER